MQVIQAIFLGLVQGVTEFIPVSSSGHLVLAEKLFNLQTSGFVFDAIINIGTIAALVIYFRQELLAMLKSMVKGGQERKLVWLIILATLPGVIAGMLLQSAAEDSLRSVFVVVLMLVFVGLLMLLVERYGKKLRNLESLTSKDSIMIGIAQILAFVPGTSRSGITITTGMARGLSRQAAAKFSFFLAIPILAGGVIKVLLDSGARGQINGDIAVFVAGILAAFVSGYAAVAFLLNYLQRHGLKLFAYYRIVLAAVIMVVSLLK